MLIARRLIAVLFFAATFAISVAAPLSAAHATDVILRNDVTKIPYEMTHRGEPISPLCFRMLKFEPGASASINNCELGLNVTNHPSSNPLREHRTYENSSTPIVGENTPYYIYTYLNEVPLPDNGGQGILLLLEWSGGGTGQFSALIVVDRDEDKLVFYELLAQGDRCNHGLSQITVEADGRLSFHQNITAYDLFELGGPPSRTILQSVKPYTDLRACSACCYGTAAFEDFEFKSVDLNKDAIDKAKLPTDRFTPKTAQNCFDEALKILTRNEEYTYSADAWNVFVKGIEKVCFNHERSAEDEENKTSILPSVNEQQ